MRLLFTKITFWGFLLCLFLPILEVKYGYINGYKVDNQNGLVIDFWNIVNNNWDGSVLLFGFRPEIGIIILTLIIQTFILLKHKSKFGIIGLILDSWIVNLIILGSFLLNLYLIDAAHGQHHVEFSFLIGSYLFIGLLSANLMVSVYTCMRSLVSKSKFPLDS